MMDPRMEALVERLEACGIMPVVTVSEPRQAVRVAEALLDNGIDVIEVTFRTDTAAEAIRLVRHHVPEMLVAAGTVLRNDQVDAAERAGAELVVSPGLSNRVVRRCQHLRMPLIPGVATPSEIQRAIEQGFELLKFFPAGALGGAATLRALAGPFPMARFVPTGGVDIGNLGAYLALPMVVACGGSWLVPDDIVQAANYRRLRSLVAETAAVLAEIRGEDPSRELSEVLSEGSVEVIEVGTVSAGVAAVVSDDGNAGSNSDVASDEDADSNPDSDADAASDGDSSDETEG